MDRRVAGNSPVAEAAQPTPACGWRLKHLRLQPRDRRTAWLRRLVARSCHEPTWRGALNGEITEPRRSLTSRKATRFGPPRSPNWACQGSRSNDFRRRLHLVPAPEKHRLVDIVKIRRGSFVARHRPERRTYRVFVRIRNDWAWRTISGWITVAGMRPEGRRRDAAILAVGTVELPDRAGNFARNSVGSDRPWPPAADETAAWPRRGRRRGARAPVAGRQRP